MAKSVPAIFLDRDGTINVDHGYVQDVYKRQDAATFTDCATGKRIAVANNAQLERDYAAARGTQTLSLIHIRCV